MKIQVKTAINSYYVFLSILNTYSLLSICGAYISENILMLLVIVDMRENLNETIVLWN